MTAAMVRAALEATAAKIKPRGAHAFRKGDAVVYPAHGLGRIEGVGFEEIARHRLNLIHISFEDNQTLRVPVARAGTGGLRKLANEETLAAALATLKGRQRISRLWGIHLTGLDDLSPRAVRRRSLQAGRMSALSRRLGRNSLWALAHNKVLVTNRSMRDSKLQDPVEQHPSAT
jgi:hypothetical protein